MPKAVVLTQFGPPDVLVWRDVSMPEPGPGQVRIHVKAAGVMPTDVEVRRGDLEGVFPLSPEAILGFEAAGVVDALGPSVSGVKEELLALFTFVASATSPWGERPRRIGYWKTAKPTRSSFSMPMTRPGDSHRSGRSTQPRPQRGRCIPTKPKSKSASATPAPDALFGTASPPGRIRQLGRR